VELSSRWVLGKVAQMVNQLEHGNSKHPARGQVCLTQIQAMVKVKQSNLLNFFQPIRA
jgi:hypothetical protein